MGILLKIALGCDHAGLKLKSFIVEKLKDKYIFIDCGTDSEESTDYPDYASKVAKLILSGEADVGILICGTGIGMCITANKFLGIYAALVYSDETAKLAKAHNNANVLCFGGRFMNGDDVVRWIEIWLNKDFEGGRHLRRINKIKEVEKSYASKASDCS